MIITQKKPLDEVLAMVAGANTVAIVGCNSCATACQTGGEPQIQELSAELEKIGYLQNRAGDSSIVLIEFMLRDEPGSVTNVLELINRFNFNISYINSQENGTDYQNFKMGLHVEEPGRLAAFLEQAEQLCKVRVIDYNSSGRAYDNSIFYSAFVRGLAQLLELTEDDKFIIKR